MIYSIELLLNITDTHGRTPLYYASFNGHTGIVNLLKEKEEEEKKRKAEGVGVVKKNRLKLAAAVEKRSKKRKKRNQIYNGIIMTDSYNSEF